MGSSSSKNTVKNYSTTIANNLTTTINKLTQDNVQDTAICLDNNCCDCINGKTIDNCFDKASDLYARQAAICSNQSGGTPTDIPPLPDSDDINKQCEDICSDTTCPSTSDSATSCSSGVAKEVPATDTGESYCQNCKNTSTACGSSSLTKLSKKYRNSMSKNFRKRGIKDIPIRKQDTNTSYDDCMNNSANYLQSYTDSCTNIPSICSGGQINVDQYMKATFTEEQMNTIRSTIYNSVQNSLTSDLDDIGGNALVSDTTQKTKNVSCVITNTIVDSENWTNLFTGQCVDINVNGGNQGVINVSQFEDLVTNLIQDNSDTLDSMNELVNDVSLKTSDSSSWKKIIKIILIILMIVLVIAFIFWLYKKFSNKDDDK